MDIIEKYRHQYSEVRVVTKNLSCQVNTTSRLGIKQQGISFGSIFLLFSYESTWGQVHSGRGKSPAPPLNDSGALRGSTSCKSMLV